MKFQLFYSQRREKIVIFMMNKIKGNGNILGKLVKSAFNKSRTELNFHIQLLVGRCTLASTKGFFNGAKNILKLQNPIAIFQTSSFNIRFKLNGRPLETLNFFLEKQK